MPIPVVLPLSQFNGEVFVSTSYAVRKLSEVPSVLLAPSHPFWQLWQHHLQCLTQPGGLFEGVVDSLAAILLGTPLWKDALTPTEISRKRSEIRSLLGNSPPNIVILKNFQHYGCHERCSPLWNYICISKRYVKLWMDANEQERQGLTALLITAIDHEMGHWAQTIKSGYCYLLCKQSTSDLSTDDLSTDLATDLATMPASDDNNSSSEADDEVICSSEVSPSGLSYGSKVPSPEVGPFVSPSNNAGDVSPFESTDHTRKSFQAPWMTGNGEAGNFVEISTRGGIMEYDPILKQPYLVVGRHESDLHFLSKSYVELYLQNEGPSSSLLFRPTSRPKGKSSHPGLKIKDVNFPFDGIDRCLSTPTSDSLYQQNYHGYVPTKVHKL